MTVKELKEKLNQFPDNCIICVASYGNLKHPLGYSLATSVSQGVNEFDGCVFIDDYVEDE